MPGGSAGTSFCSGTEISISRLAMGVSSQVLFSAIAGLRQRDHPGPELLLLCGGVEVVVANEFELAVAADTEHADGGGEGGAVAHRHRPDRRGDEDPPTGIDPESAQIIRVSVNVLKQRRLAGGWVDGEGRDRVLATREHLLALEVGQREGAVGEIDEAAVGMDMDRPRELLKLRCGIAERILGE